MSLYYVYFMGLDPDRVPFTGLLQYLQSSDSVSTIVVVTVTVVIVIAIVISLRRSATGS